MAKAATQSAEPDKKKKKKSAAAATVRVEIKGVKKRGAKKAAKSDSPKKAKKSGAPKKERGSGLEALAKLVDHPMVADLLAAGAVAAVAVIAEHRLGSNKQSSSKLVKTAGQAAAAAIGKKLMGEFGAIKDASIDAAKKA